MTILTEVVPDSTNKHFDSFKPDLTASESKMVWAAGALDPLPTRLIFLDSDKSSVEVSQGDDGMVWRRAYALVADPEVRSEFRLYLFAGATRRDLRHARGLIKLAKEGVFNEDMWTRRDDMCNWISRKWYPVNPERDGEPALARCDLDGCVMEFHAGSEPEHSMESIENPEGHYTVHAFLDDPELGWQTCIDLSPDIPDGRPGMAIMRSALNDLEWLQAECDKLNAAAGVALVGGSSE